MKKLLYLVVGIVIGVELEHRARVYMSAKDEERQGVKHG